IPYSWSDQFNTRIQSYGEISSSSQLPSIVGAPVDGRFLVRHETDGTLEAVVGWNMLEAVRAAASESDMVSSSRLMGDRRSVSPGASLRRSHCPSQVGGCGDARRRATRPGWHSATRV